HCGDLDDPTAVPLAPNAEKNAADTSCQNGGSDQQAELRLVQPEIGFDANADNRENRPSGKADGERDRRQPQSTHFAGPIGLSIRQVRGFRHDQLRAGPRSILPGKGKSIIAGPAAPMPSSPPPHWGPSLR